METVGAYRLGKTLGKGSYGKVKLGVHSETGTQVRKLNLCLLQILSYLLVFCTTMQPFKYSSQTA